MRLFALCIALIALALAPPATAHLTPNSTIELDIDSSRVTATVTIPQNELRYATGAASMDQPTLRRHFRIVSPDGRPWLVDQIDTRLTSDPPEPDFIATIKLSPPPGAPVRQFRLFYDGVIERLATHIVLVSIRRDFEGGIVRSEPALLGGLRQGQATLDINRGEGSALQGIAATIQLGMHHIAEGTDHILFLLTLLLPAPLLAASGQWSGFAGTRAMLRKLVGIVTAFTVGHSLTLIGGAYLGWKLPVQPVEIAIALSILISALHAWTPLFAGRETWVAGLFGLIHGMAFATIIAAFALDPLHKAQAILGFNLGIELVQLAIIVLLLPALVVFGASPQWQQVRRALSIFSGIAAALWIAERAASISLLPARWIELLLSHAAWPMLIASAAAIIVALRRRGSGSANA